MNWKNLQIGTKLAVGFGLMLLLLVIGGLVGYSGLKTVGNALTIIADEEAPLVDMTNEMKISLWQARNSLEEFKGATSVIARSEGEILDALSNDYQQTLDNFDKYTSAILKGADLSGQADQLQHMQGRFVLKQNNQHPAAPVIAPAKAGIGWAGSNA